MKITIYELLELIKNDKAPKKIKYGLTTYTYAYDYIDNENNYLFQRLVEYEYLTNMLTKEVEIIEVDEDPTEREKIFENIYRQNKMLHKAIYDYLGEPYEYKNGKITPISQLKKDKDIEELNIPCNFKCSKNGMTNSDREQLDFNFKNIENKINDLIKEVNKLKNN